jgi:hypothetical protein
MSNPNFRRWTSDDISILKRLAQTHPMAQLGRSRLATSVKAHELGLSLKMRRQTTEEPTLCVDPGPAGFDWPE